MVIYGFNSTWACWRGIGPNDLRGFPPWRGGSASGLFALAALWEHMVAAFSTSLFTAEGRACWFPAWSLLSSRVPRWRVRFKFWLQGWYNYIGYYCCCGCRWYGRYQPRQRRENDGIEEGLNQKPAGTPDPSSVASTDDTASPDKTALKSVSTSKTPDCSIKKPDIVASHLGRRRGGDQIVSTN
ncbi:hypothetical protein B0J13DRAFT_523234 [Dactylonectria estremocensis]|uniref:Uncharacterized protein n=1 Tax=Dactylonectria estremocensis TaxID=1079267 RepID=A0A9P9F1J4_9HYPO|nr:hypothetical protein B0J13DRAFT_523234 [Dactylonectria estremocensis]